METTDSKETKKKKMSVSAIKDGTVIDHVPAKSLFKVIRYFGLTR